MQKFIHHGDKKYYENLTNWLSTLGIGELPLIYPPEMEVKETPVYHIF
jgi:hypothetical protein